MRDTGITLYRLDQPAEEGKHVEPRRLSADVESTYSVIPESFSVIDTTDRDGHPLRVWALTTKDNDGHARVFEAFEDTRGIR